MNRYDFRSIESKWQDHWEANKTFRAHIPGDPEFDPSRPKFYVLDMFPYPSGRGLHVGHPLGYIATDIVARYRRMTGHNVLHPMGYDAFGLPAEQYAVETGTHPRVTTEANIENMRRQLKACGLSFDWDRELRTIDVDYYRWTQWIFLQLFHSWFDPAVDAARPVTELVARFEADEIRPGEGDQLLQPGDARFTEVKAWSARDAVERDRVLSEHRLAFAAEVPVNWCPALGTVLANEEVTNDGRSERGNYPVFRRPLKQWMLRITRYADRLAQDLSLVNWPEPTKLMQLNWIGKSYGARVHFPVVASEPTETPQAIQIYTTRPDTLFGATYMVLAPEHPLVDRVTSAAQRDAVDAYRRVAMDRSDLDRQAETKEKTGVPTGGFATNPVNGEAIPIWIADYVLMGYGTGAIMAVPGHDTRDFAFAKTFDLPIVPVMEPPREWFAEQIEAGHAPAGCTNDAAARTMYLKSPRAFEEPFTGSGTAVNSANDSVSLDGLQTPEAKDRINAWLEAQGLGHPEVQYKLRDWLFSRQRYWGEPFPILHAPDGTVRAVPEEDLPVELPPLEDFRPRGTDDPDTPPQPALSRADADWREVTLDGVTYTRELNTMPQWAGSCWYYLRYIDPGNRSRMVDAEAEKYWMGNGGVDLYVGGVEHAVLHLLYARFWHKVLYDLGHVTTPEPFQTLYNQGYIQAYSYQDARGIHVEATEIEQRDGKYFHGGEEVTRSLGKMGKSLKNAVSPDDVLAEYGCDTLRLYEMYLGPVDQSKIWDTHAIVGVHRFLQRVWRNLVDEDTGALRVGDDRPDDALLRIAHRTTHAVTDNMNEMRFNTAIARLIEFNNALVPLDTVPRDLAERLVLMIAPMAPHMAEELWEKLGHTSGIAYAPWPTYDAQYLVDDTLEIVVQVMGRKRGAIQVAADADEASVKETALADEGVQRHLEGKTIRKVVYVPGRIVNIVAN